MWEGWSINLSIPGEQGMFRTTLPVPPLFAAEAGPVIEIVFWSIRVERWIHGVSAYFDRELPPGHVQVTIGDLAWIRQVVWRKGPAGLIECIQDLEESMIPDG